VSSVVGDQSADAVRLSLAFKPHAGHAADTPERALWLLKQVGSPNLRVVYDYSHLSLAGVPLARSMEQLLPVSAFLAVKDSAGTAEHPSYLLPGDGRIDYVEYFGLLKKSGYRGFAMVEVSAMIHRLPGYDPLSTVRLCYDRLSRAMADAGVQRPVRS
jgi:sugar phosphate isomerase/epimerase